MSLSVQYIKYRAFLSTCQKGTLKLDLMDGLTSSFNVFVAIDLMPEWTIRIE